MVWVGRVLKDHQFQPQLPWAGHLSLEQVAQGSTCLALNTARAVYTSENQQHLTNKAAVTTPHNKVNFQWKGALFYFYRYDFE